MKQNGQAYLWAAMGRGGTAWGLGGGGGDLFLVKVGARRATAGAATFYNK
jgi:hypothetical protein